MSADSGSVSGTTQPGPSETVTTAAGAAAPSLGRTLWGFGALLFSVALLLTGNGLQGTLIPIRGSLEHFAGFQIGFLGTGYFLGFTFGCLFGPALLSRGGHIRTFMAMASIASVAALVHALFLEPVLWAVLRAITGFCFAVLYIVIESWLNEKSSNESRGAVFSVYTVINLTVVTIGQLMIALDDPAEFALFAVASILVSLAGLPLAFTKAESPAPVPAVRVRLRKLYRTSPVGVAACIAVGLANGAFWTLGPVFAQDLGMNTAGVGIFMSAVVIGGAIAQWPLGAMSDRVDRRHVILGSTLLAIVAGLSLTFLSDGNLGLVFALCAAFGAGALPIYALGVAHANDHASPLDMVEVSSGLLLVFGLGAATGPLLASIFSNFVPLPSLFAYTAIIHAGLVGFVLWRMTRSVRVGENERVNFTESAIAAQTLSPFETATTEHAHAEGAEEGMKAADAPGNAQDGSPG